MELEVSIRSFEIKHVNIYLDIPCQVCKLNIGGPSWTVGETNFYDGNGSTPIRYFEDPTLDGYSIDNAANYTEDLDSHLSCGVYNKFFFCLSVVCIVHAPCIECPCVR